jgi:hypothetical protein
LRHGVSLIASGEAGADLRAWRERGIVSKIVAFVCFAAALGGCLWMAPWRELATYGHEGWPAAAMAGGLFTIAIAVLIRD